MQELLVVNGATTVDGADQPSAPQSPLCPPDDALLLQVFRFRHKPPSVVQEESECARLARRFIVFVDAIRGAALTQVEDFASFAIDPLVDDRRVPLHHFADEELRALQRACAVLTGGSCASAELLIRGTVYVAAWFPKYGCALQAEVLSVASVALKLVILDGWEHVKHFPADAKCVHSAVPKTNSVLNCGSVRPELMCSLLDELRGEIEKAKPRTGVQRGAGFNDIGHQKTPQFIAALVRIARSRVIGDARTLWGTSQVFGTSNFFSPAVSLSSADLVSNFSRLINVILLLEDGTNLLRSEFEADAILQLLWMRSGTSPRCTFVNLSSAVDAISVGRGSTVLARGVPWCVGSSTELVQRAVTASLTTVCQLYNGETIFTKRANSAVEAALRAHLQPLRKRERAFQGFATVRGNLPRWRYSFLHTLCHEMDLGDFASPRVVARRVQQEFSASGKTAPGKNAAQAKQNVGRKKQ